ncbi:MAG: hypothetical protein DRO40_09750 [Thermoprotei archaeon]|nr:MAG: hypothetical protein DRO40_09750 [Thermoprotei archaeon]
MYALLYKLLDFATNGFKPENADLLKYSVFKKGDWIVLARRVDINESSSIVKQFYIPLKWVDEKLLKVIQKLLKAYKEVYRALVLLDQLECKLCGEK